MKKVQESIEMMLEECWIGPKISTAALDSMSRCFCIDSALTNIRRQRWKIFITNKGGEMNLQYVYNFGDWWSHTIRITKYDSPVPTGATVAYLMSGKGWCPPWRYWRYSELPSCYGSALWSGHEYSECQRRGKGNSHTGQPCRWMLVESFKWENVLKA